MNEKFLSVAIRLLYDDAREDAEALLNDGEFEYIFVDGQTLMVQEDDAQEILEILQESNIDCRFIW